MLLSSTSFVRSLVDNSSSTIFVLRCAIRTGYKDLRCPSCFAATLSMFAMFASKALLPLILPRALCRRRDPRQSQHRQGYSQFFYEDQRELARSTLSRRTALAPRRSDRLHIQGNAAHLSVSANAGMFYTAQVGVGIPATDCTLNFTMADPGVPLTKKPSISWIGAAKAYENTGTNTGNAISVTYGSGSFSGEMWMDTVTLAPDLVIQSQSIGVASSTTGFSGGVDGILGVGPVALTAAAASNTNTVPTISDNLLSQGAISEEVLGIYYVPASESTSIGTLTFGGVDDSVITSSVHYTSLTTTSPATSYWGIDQSITYGGETILSETAGIVDTGTTLILIASDAFRNYQSATGAILDSTIGLLKISASQYSALEPLSFNIGDQTFALSANAQIWPRSLNSAIGGTSSSIYLVVGDIGSPSGSGFDFINGYSFLQRYYSVYDTTNGRVGFATTAYTSTTSN
ncbi:acid protease [Chiua virens]|nr:acid protease [Chiua virens]